ncbi:MAG: hypothetical protein AAFW76_09175, partial [Pseudomonadota bacterium]
VAQYKTLLRGYLDRRPSGLRGRLARELGKHKSFISQITNPAYRVPIPAGDLETIFEVCRIAPAEQRAFLEIYDAAHANRGTDPRSRVPPPSRELKIRLPEFKRPDTGREVESVIREFAARTIRLAKNAERAGN